MSDDNNLWEDIYSNGKMLNLYPWDNVVSFVFSYKPEKPITDTRVLEVGCGSAPNLWFAARLGMQVTGFDISESAIAFAKKRFENEQLSGHFFVSGAESFDYPQEYFDLAIDRASLTCISKEVLPDVLASIHSSLSSSGHFFFNVYAEDHTSCTTGIQLDDGRTQVVTGTLQDVGALAFYSELELRELFADWKVVSCTKVSRKEMQSNEQHTEWQLIVRK